MGWDDSSFLWRNSSHPCHFFVLLILANMARWASELRFFSSRIARVIGGFFASLPSPPRVVLSGTGATEWEADIVHK